MAAFWTRKLELAITLCHTDVSKPAAINGTSYDCGSDSAYPCRDPCGVAWVWISEQENPMQDR